MSRTIACLLSALAIMASVVLTPSTAMAGNVIRPHEGDPFAVGATYTLEATTSGNETLEWYCNASQGYFLGSTTTPGPIGYVCTAPGVQSFSVKFTAYSFNHPPQETWIIVHANQYALIPIPDDDYSLSSRSPGPEPEMDGIDDFLVPKDSFINLRFALDGPPGIVLMLYNHVNTGSGLITYPATETINHDGLIITEHIVSNTDSIDPFRIKGTVTSGGRNDIEFRLRICDSGYPEASNPNAAIAYIVHCTVAEIERVDPTEDDKASDPGEPGTPSARVMLNSRDMDLPRYHNSGSYTYQRADTPVPIEGDIVAEIRVRVKPYISGITLWTRSIDPDDPVNYELGSDGDDNKSVAANKPFRRHGYLWKLDASKWDIKDGTFECYDDWNDYDVTAWTMTDDAGEIRFVLGITDHFAGDNYQVRAGFTKSTVDSDVTDNQRTCILTAWKRYYYEYDKMDRPKGFAPLSADFASSFPNRVEVASTTGFATNDEVRVFDINTNAGETAQITSVDSINGRIYLDRNLTGPYPHDESGIATTATSGYYEPSADGLEAMLEPLYCESRIAYSGNSVVPFRAFWGNSASDISALVVANFSNRTRPYHIWLGGYGYVANCSWGEAYGVSIDSCNGSNVFVKKIEDDPATNGTRLTQSVKVVSTHEYCHTAGPGQAVPNCSHTDNVTMDGTYCVMHSPLTTSHGIHTHVDEAWIIRKANKP